MSIILKENTEPSVAPGTYLARCFRIVDAGTQTSELYGEKRKLVVTWELPTEHIEVDGKDLPRSISKFYTLSLNKKSTLRKDLECWRGRAFTKEELEGFELAKVLGTGCQLSVVHSENGKVQIQAVTSLPKGTLVPPVVNPLVEYSYEQGPDDGFKVLPEWLQKMVGSCLEWQRPNPVDPPGTHAPENEDVDVPF